MALVSPVLTMVSQDVRDVLSNSAKPKFNAYFEFTASCIRAISHCDDGVQLKLFTYPNESMISDIVALWSLFTEVYEAFKTDKVCLKAFFAANPLLQCQFLRIIDGGEYWKTDDGKLKVVLSNALPCELDGIGKTLRNGFAHFHWRYDDLSAMDYWNRQNWDTNSQKAADFRLESRPSNNYTAYIADAAQPWNSTNFWDMKDLRIIVTNFVTLRDNLHRFLNIVLNNESKDVFGNEPTEPCYVGATGTLRAI